MRPEAMYKRVDHRPPGTPDQVREEVNPWKIAGWGGIVFGLTLLGIYLWHLFHGHQPILPWKPLAALSGGGLVGGGVLVSRGGDALADILEKKLGGGG